MYKAGGVVENSKKLLDWLRMQIHFIDDLTMLSEAYSCVLHI
jgi:hypothetical protein